MAVIKPKNRALAALSTAALCLPGLDAIAAVPAARSEGNAEYGYYQESNDRMRVQIYHADGLIPLTDRLEFSFSYDRDTYSGASPAWSVPETMNNQAISGLYGGGTADIVSAASAVSAETLTGGDPAFGLQRFEAYQQGLQAALDGGANAQQSSIAGFRTLLDNLVPAGTQTIQSFGTQPLETRTQPTLNAKYYFDNATLGFSGGISDEPDFISNFGAINYSHEFNEKSTTLSAGYSASSNTIYRNQGHNHSPPGVGLGHIHPADCAISPCTDYPALNANSFFHGFNLGLSQVITKNTLFNASAGYTNQSGFLDNAYKTVYIRGEITPEEYYFLSQQGAGATVDWNSITPLEIVGPELFREKRPSKRNQFSLSTGINQFIPALDASVHLDYRFYHDDWKINSHTFEFQWYQSMPFGITVTPSFRYYSQSQADFFAPYFLAPRADGHYSSDYRLSAFGALNGGVTLAKELGKGVRLEAGVDYYAHAGALKLGGGGSGNYADYSYYMVHAGLNVDLSAPGNLFSSESGHEHHQHHAHFASLPPSGVMYGHMMNQSNDVMVGYMYMYGSQGGDMLHGSHAVSDAVLAQGAKLTVTRPGALPTAQQIASLTDACPGYGSTRIRTFSDFGCLVKPHNMQMGMHMFDIMYAPTDWLNLMVMPQLVDMNMTMSGDLRTPIYDANGTNTEKHSIDDTTSIFSGMKHNVFDLGDTTLMGLFKLFENPVHHLHVGLGVSAPTGSVSEVHNVLSTVAVGSQQYSANIKVLQDIGMQAGSGTWDFKPSLTYTGHFDSIFWGGQLSSVNRLQDKNKSGYALGDIYQSTTWLGYNLFDWLSASVRGVYTQQNRVKGDLYQVVASAIPNGVTDQNAHLTISTVDYPQNTGGHYWDVGIGVRMSPTGGPFTGHTFSFEWLQPVKDYVNGYQLERNGALAATWTYMF